MERFTIIARVPREFEAAENTASASAKIAPLRRVPALFRWLIIMDISAGTLSDVIIY